MQPKQTAPIPPLTGQHAYGLHCPVCRAFIPIDMADLLHKNDIACLCCGLRLTINKTLSKPALDALAKVERAMQEVKETETFSR